MNHMKRKVLKDNCGKDIGHGIQSHQDSGERIGSDGWLERQGDCPCCTGYLPQCDLMKIDQ